MTNKVNCQKLGKELDALEKAPLPGELGKRIFENISAQAWQLWLNHQTMLINEYRLNMMDAKSREFLRKEMEKFLFGGESEKPPGYVPK